MRIFAQKKMQRLVMF